ncbi:MAG: hypothetical protein IJ480_12485 [Clostridia bacterium]|nr:hypothetical protein [Clostridia bacterium]
MFVIRPVDDKNIQKELCGVCQCDYLAEDFAYFAADLSEDGSKLLGILGICQFALQNDCGIVHHLQPLPGTFDEEVLIIMVRTAMEFVHRCGCGTMVLADGACSRDFGEKIGFRLQDGQYQINLVDFYKSPCRYQAKLTKKDEQ